MHRLHRFALGTLACLTPLLITTTVNAAEPPAPLCDRSCLYELVDQYMAAMLQGDVSAAPIAREVKFTENGIVLAVGDGLWNTISGMRGYDLKLADPVQGQVCLLYTSPSPRDRQKSRMPSSA